MKPQTERCQETLLAASNIASVVGRADIGVLLVRMATDERVLARLDELAASVIPIPDETETGKGGESPA